MVTQTELYRFSEQGTGTIWLYTSGNEAVEHGEISPGVPAVYTPVSISRTDFQIKMELARANIDVKVSLINPLAIHLMQTSGEKVLSLTIFERSTLGVFTTAWKGRLASAAPGMLDYTLKMESVFTSLRRYGIRAKYQRNCRVPLYSRGCGVDPEDFAEPGTISVATGRVLTIVEADAFADGWFLGGMLRIADGSLSYIVGHTGSQITLQRVYRSLYDVIQAGLPAVVTLYPGCDHSLDTCWDKFNNGLNCKCFRWMPNKNPVGGASIA